MLTIDGSMGEGGGQVLRSSLSLSLLTGTPFRISNIRAGRKRPGLMRQHLACVQAAQAICAGTASAAGVELGSTEIAFTPGTVKGGQYTFAIGSAGSTALVFQTVLLPLLLATEFPSQLRFEGGTHGLAAPPFEFVEHCFLPVLKRMGAVVTTHLERPGFYPAGGGIWTAAVTPAARLGRLELIARGAVLRTYATALVSQVRPSVAMRELRVLAESLGWEVATCVPQVVKHALGPGNAVLAYVQSAAITEVLSVMGERGLSAEDVARNLARQVQAYLSADAPVGEHLADQLLLPMALGEGGVFTTLAPSLHLRTQVDLLRQFCGIEVRLEPVTDRAWLVEVPSIGERANAPRSAMPQ